MAVEHLVRVVAVDIAPGYIRAPLAAARRCDPVQIALEAELAADCGILPDIIIVKRLRHRRHGLLCTAADDFGSDRHILQGMRNLPDTLRRVRRTLRTVVIGTQVGFGAL